MEVQSSCVYSWLLLEEDDDDEIFEVVLEEDDVVRLEIVDEEPVLTSAANELATGNTEKIIKFQKIKLHDGFFIQTLLNPFIIVYFTFFLDFFQDVIYIFIFFAISIEKSLIMLQYLCNN